jgi:hypothetical protein
MITAVCSASALHAAQNPAYRPARHCFKACREVSIPSRMNRHEGSSSSDSTIHRRASWILGAFLFTFMTARIIVFLILARRIPDIYLFVGGTHVHHLNYGIFLLSGVGAYLLLARPTSRRIYWVSLLYGIGLALTFDEFGMWLHLGGSYWQRASFDAVVVITAFLTLLAVAPRLPVFRPRHWFTAGALVIVLLLFSVMLVDSFRYAQNVLYRMQILEQTQPPR